MEKCEYCGEQTDEILCVDGDMVCVDCAEWAVSELRFKFDDLNPAEDAENRGETWESQ